MKIYEYSPVKNIKKLGAITGVLIIGAAVLMLSTLLWGEMEYRWVIQLLSVLMLALGVFITSRHIMKSFVYAIVSDGEQGADLTVTEIQGRHTVTVCRIGLDGIEEVVTVEQGDRQKITELKERIRKQKRKSYNYCSDLLDEKYVCIFACESGEAIAIKLSYDERLTQLLENGKNL